MSTLEKMLKKPVSIIVFSTILALISSWPAFILMRLGWFSKDGLTFSVVHAIGAFLIMFVIPAIVIKFVYKRPLRDFGLSIPKNLWRVLGLTTLSLLILLPFIFFLAGKTNFQQFYLIKHSINGLFIIEILASCLYFFSEEFLFRGVMFFGLWDRFKFHTFWITNLIFALLHIGKPGGEMFFAFFAGLLLSYTSLKTKSFIPAAVIHAILAFVLNIIVILYITA